MGRWFWLTLLALLILAGMVVGSLSAEQPEWQVAQRWLGDRQREWQHEGCPVLGGDALAGCSRTDYRAASDLAAKLPEALSKIVGKLIDSGYDPDPDTLAATAATVAALRRGAHRAEDIDPDAPRLGERALATMVDVFAMQVGFGALRLHARVADSPPAAVGLLTDGLAAAIDLAAAGIGIERAIGIVAADAIVGDLDDERLRGLEPATLETLAAAVADAEAALPSNDDFLRREIAHKITFLAERTSIGASDIGVAGRWVAWEHGFSLRAHAIALVCDQLRLLQQAREASDPASAGWTLRRRALRAMQDGLAREPTSYLGLPNVFDQERGVRRLRTALAELRQAIAFHLRRPVPELRDALGDGVLTVEIDGDAATFRSADSDVARKAVRSGR